MARSVVAHISAGGRVVGTEALLAISRVAAAVILVRLPGGRGITRADHVSIAGFYRLRRRGCKSLGYDPFSHDRSTSAALRNDGAVDDGALGGHDLDGRAVHHRLIGIGVAATRMRCSAMWMPSI